MGSGAWRPELGVGKGSRGAAEVQGLVGAGARGLGCVSAAVACAPLTPACRVSHGTCLQAGEPEVLSRFSAGGLVELMGGLAQLQHRSPAFFADAADVLATELQVRVLYQQ